MNKPNEMVVIDQQSPHRMRGGLAIMAAIAILLIFSVGTTYAMLAWAGNQTPNRFTMKEHITCDLLEPAWTNAALTDYGVSADATSDSTVASDVTVYYAGEGGNIAIPKAASYQAPGSYYKKNPFIINTSTLNGDDGSSTKKGSEGYGYVAMKVQFQQMTEDGKYDKMSKEGVDQLLKCYYIGNIETTTTNVEGKEVTTETPNASTEAG